MSNSSFETLLVRFDLHATQFAHLKCTTRWFLVNSQTCAILKHFPHPKKKSCVHSQSLLLFSTSPEPQTTANLFSVCIDYVVFFFNNS